MWLRSSWSCLLTSPDVQLDQQKGKMSYTRASYLWMKTFAPDKRGSRQPSYRYHHRRAPASHRKQPCAPSALIHVAGFQNRILREEVLSGSAPQRLVRGRFSGEALATNTPFLRPVHAGSWGCLVSGVLLLLCPLSAGGVG